MEVKLVFPFSTFPHQKGLHDSPLKVVAYTILDGFVEVYNGHVTSVVSQ